MTPRQEAEALAGRIRAYWERLGYKPAITVIQQRACASDTDARLFWVVRSDMRNGWPQSRPQAASKFKAGVKPDSTTAISAKVRVPHAGGTNESVLAPERLWRDPAFYPKSRSINDRHV